jgi:outer membrane protein OmpA-like peptidoglycan-associated protein
MRKYLVFATVPMMLSACATQPETPNKPEPKEARVSVRLVERKSDVARIEPGYEMVAGISRHVIETKADVKWEDRGDEASTTATAAAETAHTKPLIDPKVFLDKLMADVQAANPKVDLFPHPGAASGLDAPTAMSSPMKASGPKVKPQENIITVILDDSSFTAEGTELSKGAIAQLDGVANDATNVRHAVVVAGQITDSDEKRQAMLLEKRAEMVFAYLQKKGCSVVDVSRVGFAAGSQTNADDTGTHRSEIIAIIGAKDDKWTK